MELYTVLTRSYEIHTNSVDNEKIKDTIFKNDCLQHQPFFLNHVAQRAAPKLPCHASLRIRMLGQFKI